ncbi:MAG: hypothetical protein OJF49_003888 [Ktedonobacterales bacterium]|nr:MAG: hypothetical protein OJF49_003888 [Ktedonobacterales bacterium]
MSHVLQIDDEQYQTLEKAATTRGQSIEPLLAEWVETLRDRRTDPRYYETDDWLRHLGMSDEEIEESKRAAREDGDAESL